MPPWRAEALFHQVFRNDGLSEDFVPDKGLQFILRLWMLFFKHLSEFNIWLSSTVEWVNGTEDPRDWSHPENILPQPSAP